MHTKSVVGRPILDVPTIFPLQYFVEVVSRVGWKRRQKASLCSSYTINVQSMVLVVAEDATIRKMGSCV